jgi:cysteine desulfurase
LTLDALKAAISPETGLVCIMAANNETGVIQPIADAGKIVRVRSTKAHFHVDATQAAGRLALDLRGNLEDTDSIALSAHKFGGPKGVGALIVRHGVRLEPLIHGEQENGLRGGTPSSANAAGMAAAARRARTGLAEMPRVAKLRDHFEERLRIQCHDVRLNGGDVPRLPNTSSVTLPGLDAAQVVEHLAMRGVCVATGSACSSGSSAPSHVLTAMGLSYADAKSTLRISLALETSAREIEVALEALLSLTTRPPASIIA